MSVSCSASPHKPPENMTTRRALLHTGLLLPWTLSPSGNLSQAATTTKAPADAQLADALARIERRSGGQLGVEVWHTGSGRRWGHRRDERFPMCSSFKLLLAGAALHQAAAGALRLDEQLAYSRADLQPWSPVTEGLLAEGSMAVAALCAATLATSDNTAANLLLARLGGPTAVTTFLRSLGDPVTRLDRYEPEMNTPHPEWDSSAPRAMAHSLHALLLGDVLAPPHRARLKAWLQASVTGGRRLKAGLPAGWSIAEKTGTSDSGSTNDIGVVWSPRGEPLVVAAFIRNSRAPHGQREAALADVGRLAAGVADTGGG